MNKWVSSGLHVGAGASTPVLVRKEPLADRRTWYARALVGGYLAAVFGSGELASYGRSVATGAGAAWAESYAEDEPASWWERLTSDLSIGSGGGAA